MNLSEDVKELIRKEFNEFKEYMYANSPKETRDKLGQFFTPAEISIKMLERLDNLDGNILDPTCGSGNLLAAAIIAGADPKNVYGNEYDYNMVKLCRERLNKVCDLVGKPHIESWQIHRGDALDAFCLQEFGPDYKQKLIEHYLEISSPLFLTVVDETYLSDSQKEFIKYVD